MLPEAQIAGQAVTLLVYGMLATAILLVAQKSLVAAISTYALQTSLLGAIAFAVGLAVGRVELLAIGVITFVLKVGVVSRLMLRVMRSIHVKREVQPLIGITASVIVIILVTGVAFALTSSIRLPAETLSPDALPVSLALVFAGIATMALRRKAMTQAVGLLMAENGAFLSALTLTAGMPLLIEMGIFFDVLTVSVVLGIFVFRINETFASIDTSLLRRLVD